MTVNSTLNPTEFRRLMDRNCPNCNKPIGKHIETSFQHCAYQLLAAWSNEQVEIIRL